MRQKKFTSDKLQSSKKLYTALRMCYDIISRYKT